jgi:DNA replication protein DnaC
MTANPPNFEGTSGTGKTHIATALAVQAIEHGRRRY